MTPPQSSPARVTPEELSAFTRQLGAMLDAGVDVLRALRIAAQHSGSARLFQAAGDISRRLEDGREFSAAIAPERDLFDAFYLEMARQGEGDGILGQALLAVADYLDRLVAARDAPAAPMVGSAAAPAFPPALAAGMIVLGLQCLGVAAVWSMAAAAPRLMPTEWLGPAAVLWCGVCLLSGSWALLRIRPPSGPAPGAPLPQKSRERRAAETEGIVRSALQEQAEEREVVVPLGGGSRKGAEAGFTPDPEPPRLEL